MVRSSFRIALNFLIFFSGWIYVAFLKYSPHLDQSDLIYVKNISSPKLDDNDEEKLPSHYDVDTVEFLKPMALNSEYGIKPFFHFTTGHIEFLEGNLKRHPRDNFNENEFRAKELYSVISDGAKSLGVSKSSFLEGFARLQENKGMEYELYFSGTSGTFFRSFGEVEMVKTYNESRDQILHFIMPFSTDNGHEAVLKTLKKFVQNFKNLIKKDNSIWLTISWLSEFDVIANVNNHKMIYDIIRDIVKDGYAELLFTPKTSFTRGKALDFGIKTGKNLQTGQKSRLLFTVDVDIHVEEKFLRTCRHTPVEGKRVFYPVVFSLYNPKLVYDNQGLTKIKAINLENLRKVHKDFGFWRDFGFGMSCVYERDYKAIGGFDLELQGWGLEDVLLYRNFVKSDQFQVIRAPVPTLFHDWHPKECTGVSDQQIKSCYKSKSLTEGNQVMLGAKLFELMEVQP